MGGDAAGFGEPLGESRTQDLLGSLASPRRIPARRSLPWPPRCNSLLASTYPCRRSRIIVAQLARMRTDRLASVHQLFAEKDRSQKLAAAKEYMRFYLPTTQDGKLLSLWCSEAVSAA